MRNFIAGSGKTLDEALHRRADEVITELCASCLRQGDRWQVDDPDTFDTTEIEASFDAIDRALQWLNNHEDIVAHHDITNPEDEW